jgi:hypothetical protein
MGCWKAERGQRVGTGVIDPYGRPPVNKWGTTIKLLNSPRFQGVTLDLISGQSVRSNDAEVQISFKRVTDIRLNIRIREADSDIEPIVLDLVVQAVDPAGLPNPDPRGLASPVPDRWMEVQSETTQNWELYNCCIHSLKPSNP